MQRNDAEWAIPATAFVAVQFAIGLVVSRAVGYAPVPPILNYLETASVFAALTAIFFLFRHIFRMWRQGVESPLAALGVDISRSRYAILFAGLGFALASLQIGALTWLKSMLPLVEPIWADPYLASVDRALFGTDPWRIIHPLPPLLHSLVDGTYLLWFPIKSLGLICVLALSPSPVKSRAMLAYFITIGLFGVLGQYLLSSAGPIFYHLIGFGNDFRDLPASSAALATRDYLWSVYQTRHSAFGGGISAMPSIHVAGAAWLALTCQSLWKPLAIFGWAFYALIFFGSVYLGWHYVSDGVVGTLCALAAWKISDLVLARKKAEVHRVSPA